MLQNRDIIPPQCSLRELAPGMLEKRDRGRGADADAAVRSYGAARVHSRVEGAELLQVRLPAPGRTP